MSANSMSTHSRGRAWPTCTGSPPHGPFFKLFVSRGAAPRHKDEAGNLKSHDLKPRDLSRHV